MKNLITIKDKHYLSCEVVMLATEDNTALLGIDDNSGKLFKFEPKEALWGYQHLYFLSNEEIKEPCWCVNKNRDTAYFIQDNFKSANKDWDKIIATTDDKLYIHQKESKKLPERIFFLPQPFSKFIQAYIKAYNKNKPITKVLVEMEGIGRMKSGGEFTPITYQLKVNSSNEITIKKVKDSYTREELRPKFLKLCHDTADYIEKGYDEKTEFNIDKWIEENL